MLDIKEVFYLNEDIVLKGINDKFWALDTSTGSQYRLNEVSYDILSSVDGQKNIEDIIQKIKDSYSVDYDKLLSDCIKFIDLAINKDILIRR